MILPAAGSGYKPYERFYKATHQTCIAHLLRRSNEILERAGGGAVVFPRKVKSILLESLAVRDARNAGQITAGEATAKAESLRLDIRRLTTPVKTNTENDRFSRHLYANQHYLFTFLKHPGLDATNHKAEQAIRPAVVNRKVFGGNRTPNGAAAQSILMTVIGTAAKRGIEAVDWISRRLRNAVTTLDPPTPIPVA